MAKPLKTNVIQICSAQNHHYHRGKERDDVDFLYHRGNPRNRHEVAITRLLPGANGLRVLPQLHLLSPLPWF